MTPFPDPAALVGPRRRRLATLSLLAALAAPLAAQVVPPPAPPPRPDAPASTPGEQFHSINFKDTPLDMVLRLYSEITGRTMIKAPNLNASITLTSHGRLTRAEYIMAIESVLAMNSITLVPLGDRFYKVVPIATARQEGMPITMVLPEERLDETDSLVSQMVELKHLAVTDVQPIIQGLLHGYGKMQALERTNTILITDTAQNLQRILEILEYIDQPMPLRVETRIYQIRFAQAAAIAGQLGALIQDADTETRPRAATPPAAIPTPPGVIRARRTEEADPGRGLTEQEMAERGIIQGKVKIVADERSNLLIVVSEPANFAFFDRIVEALDTPVEPEVTVKVRPLEYADATEVAGILNEFIGAAAAERTAAPGAADAARPEDRTGRDLRDFLRQRAQQRETTVAPETKAKIGQLSEDTKILADERTNALLLMGRRGDLVVLEEVLAQLDIMLGQVLIEAVILEIGLNDRIESGISWLQRSIGLYNEEMRGPGGGVTVRQPVGAFGGAWASNAGNQFIDGAQVTRSGTYERGALSYFLSFYDFNVDAIIRMVASSGDARVLSTPVVMTTDNTEAKIIAGEERPIVTATTTDTGTANRTSSYQYKPIGIELTVTPRINPQRLVVMDIVQTADNVVDTVKIDGNDVPIITKREISASIAIQDRETLVLGGLVRSGARKGRSKIPILGDLPFLGALFRADDREATRTELLVLITPYVLMTPAEARRETARVHAASSAGGTTWPEGWSDSSLATLTPEQLRDREREAKEKTKDDAPRDRPEPATPGAAPTPQPDPATTSQPAPPDEWPEDNTPAPLPASRRDPNAPVGRRAPIN